jgi:Icc-related predicted phosphoesterase
VIRVAAVADLHLADDDAADWRQALAPVSGEADLLLLGGDLTRIGTPEEAEAVAFAVEPISIPVLAVLGNHDYHAGRVPELCKVLEEGGIRVLEGTSEVVMVAGTRVGVAGTKGFGGGFENACGSDFGEPEMKAFMSHTRRSADRLRRALEALEADVRVALMHYAPVPATLHGERREIYPFLGSHLLAEAVDLAGADLVVHGHAHAGSERGATPGGVPVRNVAQPVIRSAYRVYCFDRDAGVDCGEPATP